MTKEVSFSSMWTGSGSPSRASLAASRSDGSSSQASPVSVENRTSRPTVTTRPWRSAARRWMSRTSSARRKLFPSTICLPGRRRIAFRSLPGIEGAAMDLFTELFGEFLVFVYHCFDRIVIHGYLTALSRPELVVHFFRDIVGVAEVSKEALSQAVSLELAQVVAELVQTVGLLREVEGVEDGLMDLPGRPAADLRTAMIERDGSRYAYRL